MGVAWDGWASRRVRGSLLVGASCMRHTTHGHTEWGLREASQVDALFERLSAEPVAAASLGQVYKGTLRAQSINQPAI